MTTKTIFLSLLLASAACLSCEKEKSSPGPVQEIDPNAALDAQVADITGIYHGTIRHWIVNGHEIPGDTIWTVGEIFLVFRTGRDDKDSWAFLVNSDSLSAEGSSSYYLKFGDTGGNPVYFMLPINVDPVYGFSDGRFTDLTVWRSPRKAQGRFYHNAGPGRYGHYYEVYKR